LPEAAFEARERTPVTPITADAITAAPRRRFAVSQPRKDDTMTSIPEWLCLKLKASPNGLYPVTPDRHPTPTAPRIGAEFNRLADECEANDWPVELYAGGEGPRADATFIAQIYRDHASDLYQFEVGGKNPAKLSIQLKDPAKGMTRSNFVVSADA